MVVAVHCGGGSARWWWQCTVVVAVQGGGGVVGADFGVIDGVSGGEDGNAVEVHLVVIPPNEF